MDIVYKNKYLKYKHKYMLLKNQKGGKWICNDCNTHNQNSLLCKTCSETWECPACTFENDIKNLRCEICNSPKPTVQPQPVVARPVPAIQPVVQPQPIAARPAPAIQPVVQPQQVVARPVPAIQPVVQPQQVVARPAPAIQPVVQPVVARPAQVQEEYKDPEDLLINLNENLNMNFKKLDNCKPVFKVGNKITFHLMGFGFYPRKNNAQQLHDSGHLKDDMKSKEYLTSGLFYQYSYNFLNDDKNRKTKQINDGNIIEKAYELANIISTNNLVLHLCSFKMPNLKII